MQASWQLQSKNYSRIIRDNEKGIKAYHHGKSTIPKGRKRKKKKKGTIKQLENIDTALVSLYLSILTQNVNGLNSPKAQSGRTDFFLKGSPPHTHTHLLTTYERLIST